MVTAILIGAGDRGSGVYGQWALRNKNKIKFLAVAEPRDIKRNNFAAAHGIRKENCFESWEDIWSKKRWQMSVLLLLRTRCIPLRY